MTTREAPMANVSPFPKNVAAVPICAMLGAIISVGMYFPQAAIYATSVAVFFLILLSGFVFSEFGIYVAIPTVGALGVLVVYVALHYFNRDLLGAMPKNWYGYHTVISALVSAHFVFLMIGKGFKVMTWVTMTGLLFFVLLQYIIATHFRTNG